MEHYYQDYTEMDGAQVPSRVVIKRDGELFITSRQDGTIRMLVPDDAAPTASR